MISYRCGQSQGDFVGSLSYPSSMQTHVKYRIVLVEPLVVNFLDERLLASDKGTTNKGNADSIQVLVSQVTRARAIKFKETLNRVIHNIWFGVNSCSPKEDALHVPQGWISMTQALE